MQYIYIYEAIMKISYFLLVYKARFEECLHNNDKVLFAWKDKVNKIY